MPADGPGSVSVNKNKNTILWKIESGLLQCRKIKCHRIVYSMYSCVYEVVIFINFLSMHLELLEMKVSCQLLFLSLNSYHSVFLNLLLTPCPRDRVKPNAC